MSALGDEFRGWLDGLRDDELTDYRFELYDRLGVAKEGSGTWEFARGALDVVYAIEKRRAGRLVLRNMCRVAVPDVDADEFADAVIAITRACRELESDTEPVEIFGAALAIAQRRADATSTRKDPNE